MKAIVLLLAFFVGIFIGIVVNILSVLWLGFVACTIWDWFITAEVGYALPRILAYGAAFILTLYTSHYRHTHSSIQQDPLWHQLIAAWLFAFILPGMMLVSAWIFHWWIT